MRCRQFNDITQSQTAQNFLNSTVNWFSLGWLKPCRVRSSTEFSFQKWKFLLSLSNGSGSQQQGVFVPKTKNASGSQRRIKYCVPGWNKRKKARSFLVKRTELHNCRVAIIFCKINAMQIGELLMYILLWQTCYLVASIFNFVLAWCLSNMYVLYSSVWWFHICFANHST